MEPKEFIINFVKESYIKNKSITKNNLVKFIVNYCIICKKQEPSSQQLEMICQLIEVRMFNLEYAIENACRLLDIIIYKIYNKQGAIICKYIED